MDRITVIGSTGARCADPIEIARRDVQPSSTAPSERHKLHAAGKLGLNLEGGKMAAAREVN
jgi:hypothetical protein